MEQDTTENVMKTINIPNIEILGAEQALEQAQVQELDNNHSVAVANSTFPTATIENRSEDKTLKPIIGKYATLGQNVRFILSRPRLNAMSLNQFASGTQVDNESPLADVVIGNDAYIGNNVTLFGGVSIGDGAYIDDHAVVYSDIPPYSIAVGNPAQVIEKRLPAPQIEALLDLKWWDLPEVQIQNLQALLRGDDVEALIQEIKSLRSKTVAQIYRPESIIVTDRANPQPRVEVLSKCGIDIVHGCQLRCIGCPNSTLQPKVKRMSPEDFNTILGNIDVRHIEYLRLFSFGEPLLHKQLALMLEQIPKQHYTVGAIEISTNAQFADWDQLALAMQTGVLTQLVVSCDGDGTEQEYERIRTPSKWHKMIEFLERAKALRDEYQPNLRLLTRTISETPEHQARWRSILEPRGWTPEFRDWMYLPEASQNMTGHETKMGEGLCSFLKARDRLYVDWDGTVVPCCAHPKASTFGNLKENTYNDLLSAQRRTQFEDLMTDDRKSLTICNECFF